MLLRGSPRTFNGDLCKAEDRTRAPISSRGSPRTSIEYHL
uniref:Uncharacterized protein n=1 Tax=Pristionchus pacificus TaxID=54126 RepID=A0A2A6C896_PRIPA|eukprot:PDM74327.1 hypothetical protein PRIPAC_41683 [Pristionchus pacificus]